MVEDMTEVMDDWERVEAFTGINQPRSIDEISDDAEVSCDRAQFILNHSVQFGITLETDGGYIDDPLYARFESIRDLIHENERDELHNELKNLRSRLVEVDDILTNGNFASYRTT